MIISKAAGCTCRILPVRPSGVAQLLEKTVTYPHGSSPCSSSQEESSQKEGSCQSTTAAQKGHEENRSLKEPQVAEEKHEVNVQETTEVDSLTKEKED